MTQITCISLHLPFVSGMTFHSSHSESSFNYLAWIIQSIYICENVLLLIENDVYFRGFQTFELGLFQVKNEPEDLTGAGGNSGTSARRDSGHGNDPTTASIVTPEELAR